MSASTAKWPNICRILAAQRHNHNRQQSVREPHARSRQAKTNVRRLAGGRDPAIAASHRAVRSTVRSTPLAEKLKQVGNIDRAIVVEISGAGAFAAGALRAVAPIAEKEKHV